MNKTLATAAIATLALAATINSAFALSILKPRQPRATPDYAYECTAQMGFLPHIYPAKVQAIAGEKVVLEPVCENGSLYMGPSMASLFIDGNVTGLRKHIALNATLVAALARGDYTADDVVGMRFGQNMVILYVHQR